MSAASPTANAEWDAGQTRDRQEDTQPGMAGEAARETIAPGTVLAGKYLLDRVLGEGGTAVVFQARHLDLDERVAIKVLRSDAARQADLVTRFLREARALARLRSEHVAQVHDVGHLQDGTPWLVMEMLGGRDLATELDERGRLEVHEAIDLAKQVGEAIDKAHACGIVHRDLKPANLFLTQRADGTRCVKVIDFGIAKTAGLSVEGDAALTAATVVLGSPMYMSPEQIRSPAEVDERTDVWSLGVILYEVLAGRRPFVETTSAALLSAIAADEPSPLRELRPDAPAWLEALVHRCLRKRAADRPASARDVLETLERGGSETSDSPGHDDRKGSLLGAPLRFATAAAIVAAVLIGVGVWRNGAHDGGTQVEQDVQPAPSAQAPVPAMAGEPVTPAHAQASPSSPSEPAAPHGSHSAGTGDAPRRTPRQQTPTEPNDAPAPRRDRPAADAPRADKASDGDLDAAIETRK